MSIDYGADAKHGSHRALWGAVALALAVWIAAGVVDRRDRVIHLALQCGERGCSATVDGGTPLDLESRGPGNGVGLYAYAPWEGSPDQVFRNFVIRSGHGSLIRHALTDEGSLPRELRGGGWRVRSGVGITPSAVPGERSVALVATASGETFSIDVELESAADAGVIFDASGPTDGRVFVVRPKFNDAFFFDLDGGEPDGVLVLMPLRRLTVGRELLRLGGLAAEILLATIAFLAILRWLATSIGRRPAQARRLRPDRPPAWCVAILMLVTFLSLAAVSRFGLSGVPHIADETAYLFQAKIFAAGALWAPAPAAPEFFEHEHVVVTGNRWFGKYPPLFPALLALGVLAGVPWLVNPVLGALTALVVYRFTMLLADWRWAVLAWLLTLSSPFFLVMGGTMMSHMACALFVSVFIWMTLTAVSRRSVFHSAMAGMGLGCALLTRPYTALLAAAAVGLYGVAHWVRASDRRAIAVVLAVIAVSTVPFAVGFLVWNGIYTESSGMALELHSSYDTSDRLGFGPDRGAGWLKTWGSWGHTPAKALRSTHQFLDYTSAHLLGWPWRLSFSLMLALFLRGGARSSAWLLVGLFVALVVGHAPYWATQHIVYGARYWFAAVPALMALAGLGLRSLGSPRHATLLGSASVAAVLGCLVAANLAVYLPQKLRELPNYGGVSGALMSKVRESNLRNAVVFVRTEGLLYNDGFFMNDPFFGEGPVFARDLGPRNSELMVHYPGFHAYRWDREFLTPLGREAADGASAVPASRER